MSAYEATLLAAGLPPEQAARDAWANDVKRWENLEHPLYGQKEEDDE